MNDPEILTLIRLSFLSADQKVELERMLTNVLDTGEVAVLARFNELLEAEIALRTRQYKENYETFERVCAEADAEYGASTAQLENKIEAALRQIADDDFDAREKVWNEYDRELELLDHVWEQKIKTAATVQPISR